MFVDRFSVESPGFMVRQPGFTSFLMSLTKLLIPHPIPYCVSHGLFTSHISAMFMISSLSKESIVKPFLGGPLTPWQKKKKMNQDFSIVLVALWNIVSICCRQFGFLVFWHKTCCLHPFPRSQRTHRHPTQPPAGPFSLRSRSRVEHRVPRVCLWRLGQLPPASVQQAFSSVPAWEGCGSLKLLR